MKLRGNVSPRAVARKRRPLVLPVCFFLAGLWAGFCFSLPLLPVLIPAFGFAGLSLFSFRKKRALFFLMAACFFTGVFRSSLVEGRWNVPVLDEQDPSSSVYVEVTGKITGDPYLLRTQRALRWRFPVSVEQIRYAEAPQSAGFTTWVTASSDDECFYYGQTWRFRGVMRRLRRQQLHLSTSCAEAELVQPSSLASLQYWCYKGRRACAKILAAGMQDYPEQEGVLKALLLGYRSALPPRLNALFADTGTLHVFAISGLHVGVMAVLLTVILRMTGMSRRGWFAVLIPALLLYVVGTGMKSSALRAWVMASMVWIAPAVNRRADAVSALALAGACITAWNPLQLLDPGFIMSFTVVGGIVVLYPVFVPWLVRPVAPDPWRPRPLSRIRGWTLLFLHKTGQLLAVSCAAWIAAAPLSALWFQRVSLIGLPGNVIVVPGAFLVVFTGCLSLVGGSLHLFFAEVFNAANVLFVGLLISAVRGMAALPWGSLAVSAPPLLSVILWYAALLFVAVPGRKAKWTALLLFCFSVGWYGFSVRRDYAYADVLNVGPGHAALIVGANGSRMLVNAGPDEHAEEVLYHLRQKGMDRLDVLILPVALADSVRGVSKILEQVTVDEVWCTKYASTSAVFHESLLAAKKYGIPVRHLLPGETGAKGDLFWEVMYPCDPEHADNARDGSVVLRVASGGTSLLFMGAAGMEQEEKLLNQAVNPAAVVLVAGRHGDRNTLSDSWLDAVQPAHVIFSAQRYSRLGEPDEHLLQRIATRGLNTWVTGRDGTLHVRLLKIAHSDQLVIPVNSEWQ